MTFKQVIDSMDGKSFFSESFGGEIVSVKGIEVIGESGLLNLISTKQDVKDLYNDYKRSLQLNKQNKG